MVDYLTHGDDIVLDFFAGSASAAHAVIHANIVESSRRKYIMVQLPEPVDPSSEAAAVGLLHISEIGIDRLRRVGTKTKSRMPQYGGDLGFRVFRLGSSSFLQWTPSTDDSALLQELERHADHLSPDAKESDILFELLLKNGFPLTTPVSRAIVAQKDVFSVADGTLLICLDRQLTQEVIDAMAGMEPSRVICLDAGFQGNDQLKANAVQTFKARARNRETEIEFRTV
jgi:adenine-specific DNA-methyltransferase